MSTKITYEDAEPDTLGSKVRLRYGRKSEVVTRVEFRAFKAVADRLGVPVEPKK